MERMHLQGQRNTFPVTNGTPAWVLVFANNAIGTGVPSAEIPALGDPALPAATSAYVAAGTGAGTGRLTWYSVSGATSYRVYRRLDTSGYAKVADVSTLQWDDSGLVSGTVYTYSVEPVNPAGPGAWSTPASFTAP